MDTNAIQHAIDAMEQAVDKAVHQLGQVDAELQRAIQDLHQQAHGQSAGADDRALQQAAIDIHQAANRAMDACHKAVQVDPALQHAVKGAHQRASQLQQQVPGSAA